MQGTGRGPIILHGYRLGSLPLPHLATPRTTCLHLFTSFVLRSTSYSFLEWQSSHVPHRQLTRAWIVTCALPKQRPVQPASEASSYPGTSLRRGICVSYDMVLYLALVGLIIDLDMGVNEKAAFLSYSCSHAGKASSGMAERYPYFRCEH